LIAGVLKQWESGTAVEQICRKLRNSEPTFYRWKKQYGG
jgi:putative transposase